MNISDWRAPYAEAMAWVGAIAAELARRGHLDLSQREAFVGLFDVRPAIAEETGLPAMHRQRIWHRAWLIVETHLRARGSETPGRTTREIIRGIKMGDTWIEWSDAVAREREI